MLLAELRRRLPPARVASRPIDRIAWANDASVYRLVPQVVVFPRSVDDVRDLFAVARRYRVPLTFRAAGTSLSGQAVTDGILAVVARDWREVHIEANGQRVRFQPGAIGGRVNQRLAPLGRKIGPDPASINACMMGGILANNSSGMCCGVERNAYHTLRSIRFVLPDGLALDTRDPSAAELMSARAPRLVAGLARLRDRVLGDADLCTRIRRKYGMKNTMGYSLNAFLDFREPLDILAHLMIGSEGTLGFIAEATLETLPDPPFKHTGLMFFADVPAACQAIARLRDSGAEALELMDRASLRAIEDQPGVPAAIGHLPQQAAALLVEYACTTEDDRDARREAVRVMVLGLPLVAEAIFTDDRDRQAALWRVRKGLIPSVGAVRRRGTSFIIEDVVFPVANLAQGVGQLQALLSRHGYDDAIVFGHAKDGNLHFVLTQAFDRAEDVARYDRFMHELAELVAVRHGGALKAEHGTGRNMAPFVATEWGPAAVGVMREVKALIDPDGILNPGVVLNDDPDAHVRHLKALPPVEQEVDACIECGFCEPVCPSRDITLSPRQRIVVCREMSRLRASGGDPATLAALERDFRYAGLDSCATDGLCALSCPVGIDTGALVRRLRGAARPEWSHELATRAAERLALVERLARAMLRLGHATRLIGRVGPDFPRAAGPLDGGPGRPGATAVYFPSCVSRVFASDDLPGALWRVAARAGSTPWIPGDVAGHCCGLAFSSKGFGRAAARALERTTDALWVWSDRGRLDVVVDSSPCAWSLRQPPADTPAAVGSRLGRMRILDGVEFAHDHLLPQLTPVRVAGAVALHPACSARKLGLVTKLTRLAEACAERAEVPIGAGCCGFAGDHGFWRPELVRAATRAESDELAAGDFQGHYGTSRTCEIGLTAATGRRYRSFWSLLDDATRC